METQSIRVIEKKVIELKKNFNVFCNTYNKNKQGVTIIRKTKRNPIFKRSDKTRKTKCTLEKCPFFLRLRKK